MLKRTNTEEVQTRVVDGDFWSRKKDEQKRIQREKEYQQFEKELLESEELEFPQEYYEMDWNDTPAAEEEEKIPTQYDFLHTDYRHNQYHIYKQLVNISSLLSDIKDVVSGGKK